MNTISHVGDLGDVVAAMPIARALGAAKIVVTDAYNGRRQSLRGPRFDGLRPLLESQPYISGAEWQDKPEGVTHDLTDFRIAFRHRENLAQWQARFLDIPISEEPWLTIAAQQHDRTVIARSPRYHAPGFPWREILTAQKRPLFVGLKAEHYAFEAEFGKIEFQPTIDLLALAKVIAGCSLFVGNQSCPMWIALGLGVPIIQETCQTSPNTIIERPNCRYTLNLNELTRLCYDYQSKSYA